MKYILPITLLLLIVVSACEKDDKDEPGPISTTNSITPTSISDGNTGTWSISVTNNGGEVEISKIHVKEEFVSGWAQGQGTAEMDLPLSNIIVGANETKTIYSQSFTAYNTGNSDIGVKNTITVYSNGGNSTSIATYIITTGNNKSARLKSNTVQSILIPSAVK